MKCEEVYETLKESYSSYDSAKKAIKIDMIDDIVNDRGSKNQVLATAHELFDDEFVDLLENGLISWLCLPDFHIEDEPEILTEWREMTLRDIDVRR